MTDIPNYQTARNELQQRLMKRLEQGENDG